MNILTYPVSAGVVGFESPAAEYKQLELSLDELLVEHPSSTFLALAQGDSMQGVGIFSGDVLIVDRALTAKEHDTIIANLNGEIGLQNFRYQRSSLTQCKRFYETGQN